MDNLQKLAKLIRYYILTITTTAGSGHPTSSLSAADLLAVLFLEVFRFDFAHPKNLYNDRLIFSKGHATPLYYALFAAAGAIKVEELLTYRKFGSRLEGHPTPNFPFTEAATGSLGQGLSVGVGMALALRAIMGPESAEVGHGFFAHLPNSPQPFHGFGSNTVGVLKKHGLPADSSITRHPLLPRVFVLLGDGEMAEGSTWEAINIASHYKLDNLIAIVDVNRLGQSQETMLDWEMETYKKRFEAFGWQTKVIDGHDYGQIIESFKEAKKQRSKERPFAIIAKTIKGKGVSFWEDKEGWHGKPLPQDLLQKALDELGKVDLDMRVKVEKPPVLLSFSPKLSLDSARDRPRLPRSLKLDYKTGEEIATRKAYGTAITRLGEVYPQIVALDGDVKNSTYSEIFKEKFPKRFYEMYIAEQNMVGAAVGFSRLGFIPFVSTFACFLTRAFDQVRMAAISGANIKLCGSHAGVSIGEDGPSQMGLEDLAMFRAIYNSVVLYPADAVSCEKLVSEIAKHRGISYLRTTRPTTPVIYSNKEEFPIGGSKVHEVKAGVIPSDPASHGTGESRDLFRMRARTSREIPLRQLADRNDKKIIIIAAGITLYEALKAQEDLVKDGIEAIVVDCYSVKPIDEKTLRNLVTFPITNYQLPITNIITVEDHYFDGGLGDAVLNVFSNEPKVKVYKLAVTKMPRSGRPAELLDYEGISAKSIVSLAKSLSK